jgi:hypothetical protein
VFHEHSTIGLFGQRESIITLENPRCRKSSFQYQTPFSLQNNVLDAAALNIGGFFGEIHGFHQVR